MPRGKPPLAFATQKSQTAHEQRRRAVRRGDPVMASVHEAEETRRDDARNIEAIRVRSARQAAGKPEVDLPSIAANTAKLTAKTGQTSPPLSSKAARNLALVKSTARRLTGGGGAAAAAPKPMSEYKGRKSKNIVNVKPESPTWAIPVTKPKPRPKKAESRPRARPRP